MLDRSLTSDTDANSPFADTVNCCWISLYGDNTGTHTDPRHKSCAGTIQGPNIANLNNLKNDKKKDDDRESNQGREIARENES